VGQFHAACLKITSAAGLCCNCRILGHVQQLKVARCRRGSKPGPGASAPGQELCGHRPPCVHQGDQRCAAPFTFLSRPGLVQLWWHHEGFKCSQPAGTSPPVPSPLRPEIGCVCVVGLGRYCAGQTQQRRQRISNKHPFFLLVAGTPISSLVTSPRTKFS
jgi:hypothetical protein